MNPKLMYSACKLNVVMSKCCQWNRSRCIFFEFLCLFYDPVDVGNLVSGSSAFSKPSLYIWKFSVHMLLKPSLKDFDYNLPSMGNECNCLVVWTLFSIVFLWDWNEKWLFPVLWPLLGFPNLLACWVQHFHSSTCIQIFWLNSRRIHWGPTCSYPVLCWTL